ncbi:MAG: VOC family protein [Neptuniibacter sp.]
MESLVLFKLCKLDHVVLICSDISRSLHFYVDVLGCELVRTVKEIPLYQLRAGESLIDLMIRNDDQKSGKNLDHFCLQIMPFEPEKIFKMMNDEGIECGPVEQRYGASGFGRSIYIKDPDGNTIELKEA